MKLGGAHLIFIVGLFLIGATVFYTKNSIAEAQALRAQEQIDLQPKAVVHGPLIPQVNIEKLLAVGSGDEYIS